MTILLFAVCPPLAFQFFFNNYLLFDGTFLNVFYCSMYSLAMILNALMILQYASRVHLLKLRYRHVNDTLIERLEIRTEPTRFYTINVMNIVDSNTGNDIKPDSDFNLKHASCKSHDIHTLRLICMELYDAVFLVTSHFGPPVVLVTTLVLTYCVSTVCYAVYELNRAAEDNGDFCTYLNAAYHIFMSIFWYIASYLLVMSCSGASEESNRTVVNIQRILLCPEIRYKSVYELEKLCSQLVLMKVEFSACGFFTLNRSFLCTVISGVCTYKLIMMQLE